MTQWAQPTVDPEVYHKARIYTDQYNETTGWNHFIVVISTDETEDDSWEAAQLARRIMNDYSIYDGRASSIYFNGEHDFDVFDVVSVGELFVVFLDDLGS